MLRNYLTIALRHLKRQSGYTAINVFGLAIGMAACLLIGLYVEDELSYDTFHENADQIMVVGIESDFFGQMINTPYPLATILQDQIPGAEAVTRISDHQRTVKDAATTFEREQRVLKADSAFFDVFNFPLMRGNPAAVLGAPNQAVITASMAEAFFGDADPMGRTLTIEGIDEPVTVAGVARDVPPNSTIQFDLVVPMHLAPPSENQRTSWGTLMFQTYVRLSQPMAPTAFVERMKEAIQEQTEEYSFRFTALPLPDLYLSSFYEAEGFNGQRRYAYLFGTIALLILGIAAINYVNLVTAQADRRAREVGVRKTMGAQRRQVAWQFLGETALLSTGALIVALLLMGLALPAFNGLFDKELTLWATRHVSALGGLVAFVLVVSIAAGTYPAFVLAGFHPVRVLRGTAGSMTRSGGWLRKGLVVTQFAVSAGLILGTIVMYQQLSYVQTKNLGFDGEQVVTVDIGRVSEERRQAIKQEVLGHPDVRQAAIGDAMPGGFNVSFSMEPEKLSPQEQTEQENVSLRPAKVDAEYVETLGLELLAGRSFSAERATDRTQAYVLNREAVDAMGWTVDNAVGKPFTFARGEDAPMGEVIGVVENFHIESLRDEMSPVVLQMEAERFSSSGGILAAKLTPEGIQAGMDHIEQVMAQTVPEMSFAYTFLDEEFDAMYRSEERLATIFTVFAGIAIVVACMGLFGLAAFAAQRRTKEIGIRKALGASLANVVALLSKEFALLVSIALVVGPPIAYWGMQQWLQDFAYRIDVGPAAFIVTAIVALVIAGGSVSVHAVRAARTDPATALRTD
jgi:putative ABC transport system permease protein